MDKIRGKSIYRVMRDGFIASYENEKNAIIYSALTALTRAVVSYIPIILSAMIIDGLSSGIKAIDIFFTAGIGPLIIFFLSLLGNYFNNLKDYHMEISFHNFDGKQHQTT